MRLQREPTTPGEIRADRGPWPHGTEIPETSRADLAHCLLESLGDATEDPAHDQIHRARLALLQAFSARMTRMRKLEINWGDLEMAFDSGFDETTYYLDLETGEVPMVTDEASTTSTTRRTTSWIGRSRQPSRRGRLRKGRGGEGDRYVSVPERSSHEGYLDMERFIFTVANPRLRDRFDRAIQGRGAFRSFRDTLADQHREQAHWNAFEQQRMQRRMLDWLESIDVVPSNPPEPIEVPESEAPPTTDSLLEELTLLVLYLASWEEQLPDGDTVRRAWKGHVFEVLDRLKEQGLLRGGRRAKSVVLTEEGVALAKELEKRLE